MSNGSVQDCFICETRLAGVSDYGTGPIFDCPRCGRWQPLPAPPGYSGPPTIGEILGGSLNRRSRASHIVRRQQRTDGGHVGVPIADLQQWGLDDPLPAPPEQLEELILWLGAHQTSASELVPIRPPALSASIGVPINPAKPDSNFQWLLRQALNTELIERNAGSSPQLELRLTFAGWEKYAQFRAERPESRLAFMAMKFDDADLNGVFNNCFKPAVERAGFDLRRLSDHQPAGLIDDQMRVALRTCRLVVADVTHGNLGAYWEAGFAEGLGRPVVYTCRKAEWDKEKSHFDTNHLVTIIWESDKLSEAEAKLAATIRATLPAEAKMGD